MSVLEDENIVKTDGIYPYKLMMANIHALVLKYPFIEFSYYGKSVMGKKLPIIKLRKRRKRSFL